MPDWITQILVPALGTLGATVTGLFIYLRGKKTDAVTNANEVTHTAIELSNRLEARLILLETTNAELNKEKQATEEWRTFILDKVNKLQAEVSTLESILETAHKETYQLQQQIAQLMQERDELAEHNKTLLDRVTQLESIIAKRSK